MSRPSRAYRFVAYLSQPLRWLYRLEARGVQHVPTKGGFVLAANHVSNFDPWPLGLPLFPAHYLRFMGKSELFWWPLSTFIEAAGAFKVRRGQGDAEAMATAVDLVRAGEVVVMFPEGTRQKKGLVKKHQPRAHTGAARIARDANAPLVPAAIKGTDRLLRLGKLNVAYGEPIAPGDDLQATTDRLMAEIRRLHDTL
jgi:1-acyl-sn-glycerol-3-phosphate acyltransferase